MTRLLSVVGATEFAKGEKLTREVVEKAIKNDKELQALSKKTGIDLNLQLFGSKVDDTGKAVGKIENISTKKILNVEVKMSDDTEKWINSGNQDYTVYTGVKKGEDVYTGITKQELAKRLYQHNYGPKGKNLKTLEKLTDGLTKNQARAVEQYLIENGPNELNKANSISPKSKYYKESQDWAKKWIQKNLGK